MNKIFYTSLLIFAFFCASFGLMAQAGQNNLNAYNAISAKVLSIDYGTPNDLENLGSSFGVELAYRRQLGKYFGLALPLKLGVIDVGELENTNFASVDLLAHLYPVGSEAKLSPYLLAGAGIVSEAFDNSNTQIPLGAGLNIRLGKNSFLGLQGEYRLSSQDNRNNLQYGIGYTYRISSSDSDGDGIVDRQDGCPDKAGPLATNGCPDQDGDGILDDVDKCPTLAGNANLMGCPDTDGDGIIDPEDQCPALAGVASALGCPDQDGDGVNDADDACPQLAGLAENRGCPDTDGDGIFDDQDKCPNQAATTPDGCPLTDTDGDGTPDASDRCPTEAGALQGCPDTDGDGIANPDDRCPSQAGPKSNQGCPEIKEEVVQALEFATQSVQFETGSAKLKAESYESLNEIANIMKEYQEYSLIISGHTDDVGPDVNNQILSEERASACKQYLTSQGISPARMTFIGYGETRPRADNGTASGRRLNRRVEFDLKLL